MRLKLLILFLVAVFCSACTHIDPEGIRISGFKQGLVAFDKDGRAYIYKQGHEFAHEVNGTCMTATKEVPCQWYGFEFSYETLNETTKFDCTSELNRPQRQVYPGEVVAENTRTLHWGFTLDGHKGHYLRPQYTADLKGSPMRSDFSCMVNGKEVLRWQLTLIPSNAAEATPEEKKQLSPENKKYVGTWVITYGNGRLSKLAIYPDGTAMMGGLIRVVYTWNISNDELVIVYRSKNGESTVSKSVIGNDNNSMTSVETTDPSWNAHWTAKRVSANPVEKIDLYELCTTSETPNVWECQNVGSDEYCSGTVPWEKTTSTSLGECIKQCGTFLQGRLNGQYREHAKLESCKSYRGFAPPLLQKSESKP